MELLIIEDDSGLRKVLQKALEEQGHFVTVAMDGVEGLELARHRDYDVILLDVMLPGIDGITVMRQLRRDRRTTPIIIITARNHPSHVVEGLDEGADHYLVKPFALEELYARIRAAARRTGPMRPNVLDAGGLALDLERRVVVRDGRVVTLTPTEFRLLEFLMRRPGRVVSRDTLLDLAWGDMEEVQANTVEVFMSRVRSKLNRLDSGGYIVTERGIGYSFRVDDSG
jgi:DNA-binding response OmpR family regulator